MKTGLLSSEPIPTNENPSTIVKDQTGRALAQCATILGGLLDPGKNLRNYRHLLLNKLLPDWTTSDPIAKPKGWEDRCVSGTPWADPHPAMFRVHNMSANLRMADVTACRSLLENASTRDLACELTVNCGCSVTAPFALVFEAVLAMEGSSLGDGACRLDGDNRIVWQDGMGLVQVGDVGKAFSVVAFGGDVSAMRTHASSCRSTKKDKAVVFKGAWPSGRALVREEFSHGLTDTMRDYGYVDTGGSGNLLISRNHPMDLYRILGVCTDNVIPSKKGLRKVMIR